MHIGFLASEFPHPEVARSAGIGTSIYNLSKGLLARGHKVSVILYAQKSDKAIAFEGIEIYFVKSPKLKGFSRLLLQRKLQRLINKLVKNENLDLMEAPDWIGMTSNIKPKCPVVVRLHGSDTYFCHLDQRPVKPINRRREEKALKNADAIVSVSQFTANVTRELFGLQPEIAVVPNGIEIAKFEPSTALPKKGVILYFGTLIRKKGLLELAQIFNLVVQKHPESELILVGKDSADILTKTASTWKLMQELFTPEALSRVNYRGTVKYSEVRQQIDEAEVCVFPTFAEALPVSWIEAMAMEKPIVASNIGWASEMIANRNEGFLVHPKSHREFADRICELLENPGHGKNMGKNAREKAVAVFSAESVALKNEAFYQKVIGSSK
ncbi:glycosyltransferase family 4 protein [Flavobacterium sp.]|uniref:glycosyltransferase family 4 protein n=1 Tax=Flavobacterium sp. TaxID=239 RepID=UPI0011F6AB25|nr:glycosyltransferase family 4 protein [Flavobacterium sp.]RZJ70867.1 MAG: glycosyltransferase family 1 protein [Flavobacterium sp.]